MPITATEEGGKLFDVMLAGVFYSSIIIGIMINISPAPHHPQ